MSSWLEANLLRSGGAGRMSNLVTEKQAQSGSFSGMLPSLTPKVMTFQLCRGEVGFNYMKGFGGSSMFPNKDKRMGMEVRSWRATGE